MFGVCMYAFYKYCYFQKIITIKSVVYVFSDL